MDIIIEDLIVIPVDPWLAFRALRAMYGVCMYFNVPSADYEI